MRAYITGATGFVGSNVASEFAAMPDTEVHCPVRSDHPDPSLLTVLTCPADAQGRNALDVAVFQRRWDVSEGTFRPPYFHRNSAVEFNPVVSSADTEGPWQAGAFSFTPYLAPHGVSAQAVTDAASDDDAPTLLSPQSIWLQLESMYPLRVMPWMIDHEAVDPDYLGSFAGYPAAEV